jgi:hypothetical protein
MTDAPSTEKEFRASLTAEEREAFNAAWIAKKLSHPQCELCSHTNSFRLSDTIVTAVPVEHCDGAWRLKIPGATIQPSVTLTCSHCGNTKLINFLVLGVDPDHIPPMGGEDALNAFKRADG